MSCLPARSCRLSVRPEGTGTGVDCMLKCACGRLLAPLHARHERRGGHLRRGARVQQSVGRLRGIGARARGGEQCGDSRATARCDGAPLQNGGLHAVTRMQLSFTARRASSGCSPPARTACCVIRRSPPARLGTYVLSHGPVDGDVRPARITCPLLSCSAVGSPEAISGPLRACLPGRLRARRGRPGRRRIRRMHCSRLYSHSLRRGTANKPSPNGMVAVPS